MLTRYFASAFVALAPLALFAQLSEVEPNDGFPQANALPPNTTMTGTVGCLTLDDDRFYLVVPTDGVLTITAQVSSTFSTDLQLNVYRGDGSGFPLSYHTAASSSGGAITTTMIRNCTAGSDYHFLLGQSATDCFSYVISWTVAAPLFGNDTEPNDGFPIVTLTPPNTDTDGHTNFLDYGTNDDRFRIDAADDGILTINWSAENAGAADATGALIQLYRGDGSGFAVETDSVPVGGGGTASTAQLTWTCRGASCVADSAHDQKRLRHQHCPHTHLARHQQPRLSRPIQSVVDGLQLAEPLRRRDCDQCHRLQDRHEHSDIALLSPSSIAVKVALKQKPSPL